LALRKKKKLKKQQKIPLNRLDDLRMGGVRGGASTARS